MGTYYSYANLTDQEFLLTGNDLHPSSNPKRPTDKATSEVLFELMRGPWNGKTIQVVADNGDQEAFIDYDANIEGWTAGYHFKVREGWVDALDKHAELIDRALEDDEVDESADSHEARNALTAVVAMKTLVLANDGASVTGHVGLLVAQVLANGFLLLDDELRRIAYSLEERP
jgi:hypothetical protein